MAQPWVLGRDRVAQEQLDAVAVHDVGGMDDDREEEALRVDRLVPLAPLHLLATIEAAQPADPGRLDRLAAR